MQLKPRLTLKVARDIILNLIMAWRAEEQRPIHQRKLLEHRQRPVAQRTVDHVPLARAESWQDKPTERQQRKNTVIKSLYLKSSGGDTETHRCHAGHQISSCFFEIICSFQSVFMCSQVSLYSFINLYVAKNTRLETFWPTLMYTVLFKSKDTCHFFIFC